MAEILGLGCTHRPVMLRRDEDWTVMMRASLDDPDMPAEMERELEEVVRILVQNQWPWRMHATYDETISRALDVFEKVNQDTPLSGLHWFFDHAETISDQSIERIAALGGGIAIQHRMAYQGEYFVERYGFGAAEATPPIKKIIDRGVKVSAGTDATRVASYNPWISLAWLVTGKTVGEIHRSGRDPLAGYEVIKIGLLPPRAALYERIHARVQAMIRDGWIEEVRQLVADGVSADAKPFQFIGYAEWREQLAGRFGKQEALLRIQQATRNFAKRQITWFRKEGAVHWLEGFGDDPEIFAAALMKISS